jgi:sphinganine-1-phosphate aldolase
MASSIQCLAEPARRRHIWLHVDAGVGGYIAPFARMIGAEIPDFDFAVLGVMPISADLRTNGYTAEGAFA